MARLVLKDGISPKQLGALIAEAGRRRDDLARVEQAIVDSFDLSDPAFEGVQIKVVYDDIVGRERILHVVIPDLRD